VSIFAASPRYGLVLTAEEWRRAIVMTSVSTWLKCMDMALPRRMLCAPKPPGARGAQPITFLTIPAKRAVESAAARFVPADRSS